MQLLALTWGVYEDGIVADTKLEIPKPLDAPDAAVGTGAAAAAAATSGAAAAELLESHERLKSRLEHFQDLARPLKEGPLHQHDEDAAEAAWLAFRLLLSDWGRFRQLKGDAVVTQ